MFGGGGSRRRGGSSRVGGAISPPTSLPGDMSSMESKMVALWDDHATFTYLVLVGKANKLPETDAYRQRLLANQDQIGYLFLPKFGANAANSVASLLREHISIADQVIDAVGKNNFNEVNARWISNAEEIGAALFDLQSKGGPYLMSKDSWMNEMKEHLKRLTVIVSAYLTPDGKANAAAAVDPYIEHIRHLAMALAKLVSGRLALPVPYGFIVGRPTPYNIGPRYVYSARVAPPTRAIAPVIPEYPPWIGTPEPPYRFPTKTLYYPN